jgi:hypothetical protein
MRVLGIDPRVTEPPVGMADLATPDRLEERLGEADFVILTVTADLVEALRSAHLAGAGLDVADPEPLPADHPLWSMPNVHCSAHDVSVRAFGRGPPKDVVFQDQWRKPYPGVHPRALWSALSRKKSPSDRRRSAL